MLYRFQIELSDVDRGVYETLDFRLAQHPSETLPYLLTRVLAYALSYQDGLEFSAAGLSDPEAAAMTVAGNQGSVDIWIEIGNPSARKLHKASKAAKVVRVYTYKNPEVLLQEIRNGEVHRADEIEIFAVDTKFLDAVAEKVEKNNRWSLLYQQGQIDLQAGNAFTSLIKSYKV